MFYDIMAFDSLPISVALFQANVSRYIGNSDPVPAHDSTLRRERKLPLECMTNGKERYSRFASSSL